ncbi:MAG TPA: hypothetical protein VL494_01645 [Steroidobacteraceae bacterium]|nr:hypothetical protein [Steroidobacteraceae bacterium]
MRRWIALAALLFPLVGLACEGTDRRECKKQFRELVSYRAQAIDTAFGDLFGALPTEIQIKFVTTKDPEYILFGGREGYDLKKRTMIFPRRVLGSKTPNPLRWAAYYWPFYQNEQYRLQFPVVEVIDNVLWNAFLQEAAAARGGQWPPKECSAVDVGRRLPCEMLVKGIAENVKALRGPLFNENRVDQIWPEDFAVFRKRVWRTDQEYQDVQRYGGIMLIKPLIDEFGVPRTLAYVAQTPFRVDENNNLREAALQYQDRARESLSIAMPIAPAVAKAPAEDQELPQLTRAYTFVGSPAPAPSGRSE